MSDSLKIAFAGGGTGGHLFPALNMARAIAGKWDSTFLFFGTRRGIESVKVPAAGYKLKLLPVTGIQRRLSISNLSFPFKLWQSIRLSRKALKAFPADLVIGSGGYVMGPVLYAAQKLGLPTVIQEQNSYPGLTTRWLAKKADLVFLAYAEARSFLPRSRAKIIITGNPIDFRPLAKTPEIFSRLGLSESLKTILAFGGSQGAASLNRAIAQLLTRQILPQGYQLLWQTGAAEYEKYRQLVNDRKLNAVHVCPFIEQMSAAYSVAEFAVCRAGAMTLSELMAAGLPAILIPFPFAAADHQYKNALALAQKQAALVIRDDEKLTENLAKEFPRFINDEPTRNKMAKRMRSLYQKDTLLIMLKALAELLTEKRRIIK